MDKLSRSKIELFLECPRCFWLDKKKNIKRPPPAPYTINNAVDYLLKQEFDVHREAGTRHPIMEKHGINAIPYRSDQMNKWRHNFTGVQHIHKPSGYLVFGAVDDVWVDNDGSLMVVDYKATGANQHKIYSSYGRQMEIYQWLLRQNGFNVSTQGYFVFARVNKGDGFGMGQAMLPFDIYVESYQGDDSWIEIVLSKIKEVLDGENIPLSSNDCQYCVYSLNRNNI